MKRIIEGKTYNTETSIKLHSVSNWDSLDAKWSCPFEQVEILYQTRHGALFLVTICDDPEDVDKLTPLAPSEAQKWLEENNCVEIIEKLFGEMPEAGESESRITLRMPDTLKNKIELMAQKNGQSMNAWIVKKLEQAIAYERG